VADGCLGNTVHLVALTRRAHPRSR
jgi:hypothetical protein